MVTFHGNEYPTPLLLWAVGAVYFEAEQIFSRETSRTTGRFLSRIRSYLRQDPFNGLDSSALIGTTLALALRSYDLNSPDLWGVNVEEEAELESLANSYASVLAISIEQIEGVLRELVRVEHGLVEGAGQGQEVSAVAPDPDARGLAVGPGV